MIKRSKRKDELTYEVKGFKLFLSEDGDTEITKLGSFYYSTLTFTPSQLKALSKALPKFIEEMEK